MKHRLVYFVPPALALVGPLLLLPSVARVHGPDGLAILILGLSCGALFAIVAELGWALTGPMQVSSVDCHRAAEIYRLSVATKLFVALMLVPPLALLVFGPLGSGFDTFAIAIGSLFTCFSSSWFFAGRDQPWSVVRLDSAPRFLAALTSSIFMLGSAPLWAVGVVSTMGTLLAVMRTLQIVGSTQPTASPTWGSVLAFPRTQIGVVRLRLTSGVYQAGAPAVASALLGGSFTVYAAADRLLRLASAVLQVIPLSQQAQLGRAQPHEVWAVGYRLVIVNFALAFVGAVSLVAFTPVAETVVFSNVIDIPLEISLLAAVALFFGSLGRAVAQLWLVRIGAIRSIEIATYIAACSFALLMFGLVPALGIEGAMAAVAGAEFAGCTTLLVATLRHWRSCD